MREVVALYMAPDSVMFDLLAAENVWAEKRDARKYRGSAAVVAAPPCAGYSAFLRHFAAVNADRDACAPVALKQVRRCGGVLEHPKHSRLWHENSLPAAGGIDRDRWGGWTAEVWQFDWWHVSHKKTWLYIIGLGPAELWRMMPPRRRGRGVNVFRGGTQANCTNLHRKMRSGYTPDFAAFLIDVASRCKAP